MSMELIDRNKIKYLSIPIAPVLVGENVHYEMGALKEWIDDMPTVEAIPIEKLEQIREEIADLMRYYDYEPKIQKCLDVIDKAIKEETTWT